MSEIIKSIEINKELKEFFDKWHKDHYEDYQLLHVQQAQEHAEGMKLIDTVDYNYNVVKLTDKYINHEIAKIKSDKGCWDNTILLDNPEESKLYNDKYCELLELLRNREFNCTSYYGYLSIYITELSSFWALLHCKGYLMYDYIVRYETNPFLYIINKLKEKLSEFMPKEELDDYVKNVSYKVTRNY